MALIGARRQHGRFGAGKILPIILPVILAAAGLFGGTLAAAEEGSSTPSISSDKADYSPGEMVTLTGAGWQSQEAVHVFVIGADSNGENWTYEADPIASETGAFVVLFQLPDWFVANYSVAATGASGSSATTSFTDANFTIDAVYPFRLAGGSVVFSTGGNGSGDHFVWHRQLPAGTYTYTGFTFNGANSPNFTMSLGATAIGTYEVNVGASGTSAPSTTCSGSSCGRYGIWGPNSASFTSGQSLTISGGGAKQSQTSGAGRVTVRLFNPSNAQVGADLVLNTDANGVYSSGTIRTFNGTDPAGTWRIEISSGARYDGPAGFTSSTNITLASAKIAPTTTFTGAPATAAYQSTFTVASSTNASTSPVYTSSGVCTNVGTTYTMTSGTGTCTSTVSWATDDNYLADSKTQSTTATKIAPTVSLSAPATAAYQSSFTPIATTNASTTATITVDSGSVCTFSAGSATMTSGTGTCALTATWAADSNYNGATANSSTTATKIAPTTTFTGAPATAAYQSTFTVASTTNASTSPTYSVDSGVCTNALAVFTMTSGTGTCVSKVSWATDDNYLADSKTQSTTATKIAPTIIFSAPPTPAEGSTFTVSATSNSSGAITYSWVSGPCAFVSGATFSSSDSGTCTVRATVATDNNYNSGSGDQAVAISNVPPTILSITAVPTPVQLGASISANASFTDPGTADTHTCEFSWDDSTPNTVVSGSTGSGTCTTTHVYAAAGVYTLTLVVADDDGGSANSIFQYVVVYDPNAGFVTGGGWIDSVAGSYRPNLGLSGRANFGFVSKYQKGATVPVGETEFQFQVGNVNFHSEAYQWLVVSGPKAQYMGTGTLNGVSGYGFLLTATDGQVSGGGGVDKFRMKIWKINSDGTTTVVYDNVPTATSDDIDLANPQTLGGGSIVIHK